MKDFLKGKKAYIAAICLAIVALIDLLAEGCYSVACLTAFAKTEVAAAAIAAVRAAISKT